MDGGEESFFSHFVTQMKLSSLCQKLALKLESLKKKNIFDIPKFKFQNSLKQEISNLWAFF